MSAKASDSLSLSDCRSGGGPVFDYYWGTELYPRICGVDVKKFVNCRFSMTFWQLAGVRELRAQMHT